MRSTIRRVQVGLGVLTAASAISLLAPAPAFAGPCYTIYVDGQAVRVCPGQ